MIPAEAVERFRADLEKLTGGPPIKLGVAVSGGPDSLALLLLATAAYPGRVQAATVDHGLRKESADESRLVATICAGLGVPHESLAPIWEDIPSSSIPAGARAGRYWALSQWAGHHVVEWIATAHHVDDQAETFLMRAARGSGVAGLAGVRALNGFPGGFTLLRPLLRWRKAELREIVDAAGLTPVDDPTNDSDALDRTHVRRLLEAAPWLRPERVAASAGHLFDAEEALRWTTERVVEARLRQSQDKTKIVIDPRDLPRELQRRLLLRALSFFTDEHAIPGPKLIGLLDALLAGRTATLADARVEAGDTWRVTLAPPRKS